MMLCEVRLKFCIIYIIMLRLNESKSNSEKGNCFLKLNVCVNRKFVCFLWLNGVVLDSNFC